MEKFTIQKQEFGDIVFHTPLCPHILELKTNGDIYVKGKLVTNDMEVVEALREYLGLKRN